MTPATAPRVLIIYAHPEPHSSVANQCMLGHIQDLPNVTVHDLYACYPDFFIDIAAEHQKLLEHDVIVFQHPLYLYSCPALLKEWMDRVLDKGFAFGSQCALRGKFWRSVITTGGQEAAFTAEGYNRYPLSLLLKPFEMTASLCQMQWLDPLILYWSRNVPESDRQHHAHAYRQWLANPALSIGGEVDDGDE